MFGGDQANTGRLGRNAPTKQPSQIWETKLGGPIVGSPTIGPKGTIFVTSHDHSLYAVDSSGKVLWKFETKDRVWSTPAVAVDGTVYVGSDDDHLYAVDGNTGSLKWKFRVGNCSDPLGFGPEGTRCDVDGGPTIGDDGTVYVGGDGLYAIWSDGTLRWKFATPAHVRTAPAITSAGNIAIGCMDDALYVVRPDGTKEMDFRTGRDIESSPAIGADDVVYFGSDDDGIYAVSPTGRRSGK